MAAIGLKHFVVAKVASETPGAALTYEAGMVVGKAMQANLTLNRPNNPLFGDDVIAENDNGVTGGTIQIGVTALGNAVRAYMLGDEEVSVGTGTSAVKEYEVTDEPAPYVGFGFLRTLIEDGARKYEAVWIYKAQFGENTINATTKGQQVEWQTPTLDGILMGVQNDADGKTHFYRYANHFTTEAQAAEWLDDKAGITATTTETTPH